MRTAGTAREKVARGNLLRILTAGEDVEDEDLGDAEASYSTWGKNPPADFLQMQEAESPCAIRG